MPYKNDNLEAKAVYEAIQQTATTQSTQILTLNHNKTHSCDLGLVLSPSIEEPWAIVIGHHTSAKLEPEGATSLACSCK